MNFDIITLFPEMLDTVFGESIIGRARKKGLFTVTCHNLRDYSEDKHRRVDDSPYGGGSGMIFKIEPVAKCIKALIGNLNSKPHVIYMSPQGKVLTQKKAKELVKHENIIILCGHYEGIDERIIESFIDEEISIGDYVVTGGELPAAILVDCVCRMIPGVLADESGFTEESHYDTLLEYPQYTRPEVFEGKKVPEVLLSGHHSNISEWRRQKSIENTFYKRPELLKKADLTEKEKKYIQSLKLKRKLKKNKKLD